MAKQTLQIKCKMPNPSEYARLARWLDNLSQNRRQKFIAEWSALKEAGAEIADVGFSYGIVNCWISDDFRKHCRKYGFEFERG